VTSKEFADGLIRCVRCAENWSGAPWSALGGWNLKVEEMSETLLADQTTLVRMKVRVHTEFAEDADEDGEFSPSRTERFTISIVKEGS